MYKFSDSEHSTVTNLETGVTGIHPGMWMWDKYVQWVNDGGITAPWKTTSELLAEAKISVISAIVDKEDRESWKPIQYKDHPMKCTLAVTQTIDRFRNLSDESPVPMLDGHWNDVNEVPVTMTMGELRALADLIYDRGMYNYGVRLYHTAAVNSITDIAEVVSYDYSTNWL